ncbi:MAG TPA: hypothetical protein VIX42_06820, partial [Edaphobacter sp.]
GAFDDELPKDDQTRSHEDPDQNLFDGRVQSEFPLFPVWSKFLLSDPAAGHLHVLKPQSLDDINKGKF